MEEPDMTDKEFLDALDCAINTTTFSGCITSFWLGDTKEEMEKHAGSWVFNMRVDELAHLSELARKGLDK